MVLQPDHLSDDDLRAAVGEARRRLPHHETCEHCADRRAADHQAVIDFRRSAAEFNDQAVAGGGYVIPSNYTLVHRWDCPSIQAQLRYLARAAARPQYEQDYAHGGDAGQLPTVITQRQARDFVASTKNRRGCRTCAPDL